MVAQREEALANQLKEMRGRQKKLVDPLQFEMSIQAEDLSGYVPTFGWEILPPSEKQKKELERFGIASAAVESTGKATMLLNRLYKRQREGYARPKQINVLEQRGFQNVGTWSFEQANKMISRIAAQGWRGIPPGIDPRTYIPEEA